MSWFSKSKNKVENCENESGLIEKCMVYYISCDAIRPNAMRARCDFDEDKLINLAYSIKRYGVIEPITVRETDAEDSYDYELITGERRLRAARLAGLTSIPCIIVDIPQGNAAELSIVENIYSEPLNYFEYAAALQRIKDFYENDISFEDLAAKLSVPQSELLKKLWLLELDYNERQILLNMNVSEEIAVGIAQISDKTQRHALIESICGEGLNDNAIKERLCDVVDSCKRNISTQGDSSDRLPRDVASVVKGLAARVNLLNRRVNRAELKISRNKSTITATIRIKL